MVSAINSYFQKFRYCKHLCRIDRPLKLVISDYDICSGTTLEPAETCTFVGVFDPESLGSKVASVNISFTDMELEPLEVPLSGLVTEVCECKLICTL